MMCARSGRTSAPMPLRVHITRLHVDETLLVGDGARQHIDPVRWLLLIMSFCRFFGLGGEVHPSCLAESDFMKFVMQSSGIWNSQSAIYAIS